MFIKFLFNEDQLVEIYNIINTPNKDNLKKLSIIINNIDTSKLEYFNFMDFNLVKYRILMNYNDLINTYSYTTHGFQNILIDSNFLIWYDKTANNPFG